MLHNGNSHSINSVEATIDCFEEDRHAISELDLNKIILEGIENISPQLDEIFGDKHAILEHLHIEINLSAGEIGNLRNIISDQLLSELKEIEPSLESAIKSSKKVIIKSPEESEKEAFLYFLECGRIPWHSSHNNFPIHAFENTEFHKQVITLFKRSTISLERFINQYDLENYYFLIKKIFPNIEIDKINKLVIDNVIFYKENESSVGKRISRIFQTFLLEELVKKYPNSNINAALSIGFWTKFLESINKIIGVGGGGGIQQLILSIKREFNIDIEDIQLSNRKIIDQERMTEFDEEHFITAESEEVKEGSKQSVSNAGLMLLHPFLEFFFTKIGLLKNKRFDSILDQQKAICLCHYLATGETTFKEYLLQFPKFICNYSKDQTIPIDLILSKEEMKAAHSLLEAAIEHWGVLKKTSIDGLRINFLQRRGLLLKQSPGYNIHIEKLTQDILLERLPWNLSIVKWPWNPNIITVKW